MALGAERTRLKQGRLGSDTPHIDVLAGLHVIKGIGHHSRLLEECVGEDVRRLFADHVKTRNNVALHVLVHVDSCGCSSLSLRLTKMLFAEEELTIQVAYLNNIRISQHD